MDKKIIVATLAAIVVLAGCTQQPNASKEGNVTGKVLSEEQTNKKIEIMKKATIETNYGNIVIEFFPNDAPKTVENFQKLASSGFYTNVIFHRVIKGFMIQGGDPTGTGTGGPGYKFNDEINPSSDLYKTGYKKGIVAMANSGPNTNGSQFFIMHQETPLPPSYTIFGKVVEGIETVDKIATVETDGRDKPLSPVTIKSVTTSN